MKNLLANGCEIRGAGLEKLSEKPLELARWEFSEEDRRAALWRAQAMLARQHGCHTPHPPFQTGSERWSPPRFRGDLRGRAQGDTLDGVPTQCV